MHIVYPGHGPPSPLAPPVPGDGGGGDGGAQTRRQKVTAAEKEAVATAEG